MTERRARRRARHCIGGEWLSTGSEQHRINPATGGVIGSYHDGGAEAVQARNDDGGH